jgi:hypothetical protein
MKSLFPTQGYVPQEKGTIDTVDNVEVTAYDGVSPYVSSPARSMGRYPSPEELQEMYDSDLSQSPSDDSEDSEDSDLYATRAQEQEQVHVPPRESTSPERPANSHPRRRPSIPRRSISETLSPKHAPTKQPLKKVGRRARRNPMESGTQVKIALGISAIALSVSIFAIYKATSGLQR